MFFFSQTAYQPLPQRDQGVRRDDLQMPCCCSSQRHTTVVVMFVGWLTDHVRQ